MVACPDFKILPILVSGEAGPGSGGKTEEFLKALAKRLKKYPGKVCIVAGVDLAHIGRRFGDDFDVDRDKIEKMKEEDKASIKKVNALEKVGGTRS